MAVKLIIKYKNKEKLIPISESPLTFGRSDDCDITLKEESISGQHCTIQIIDGEVWVIDNESKNGTTINNQGIKRNRLFLNDVVQIGEIFLEICSKELNTAEQMKLMNRDPKSRASSNLTLPKMSDNHFDHDNLVENKSLDGMCDVSVVTRIENEQLLKKLRKEKKD